MINHTCTLTELFDAVEHGNENYWKTHQTNTAGITESWDTMKQLFHDGYKEGVSKVKHGLALHTSHVKRERFLNVVGYELDPMEFIAERPFMFIDEKRSKKGKDKTVSLKINIFTAWNIDTSAFAENMGTLLGLLNDIERTTSIRFKLIAYTHKEIRDETDHRRNDKDATFTVLLNKNVLSDIAIIAHNSFYRRCYLAYMYGICEYVEGNGCEIQETVPDAIPQEKLHRHYASQEERERVLSAEIERIVKLENIP